MNLDKKYIQNVFRVIFFSVKFDVTYFITFGSPKITYE